MTNIVTINTDASYHPAKKVGSFAFWIVFQGQRLIQSGPLKSCISAHDAEIQAIGNALYALWKQTAFKHVTMIIINTDCQHAINAIDKRDRKFYKGCDESIRRVKGIIKRLKLKYKVGSSGAPIRIKVSWRYVKAHTAGETARLWVNNRLDRLAKDALWAEIKAQELKKAT